ncbi:hypothetical protein CCACVL1_30007 [Corchorus capsularis]|uniref:Uncharacterized protein n=1 Tax=Corchorus capsularis TaxID=210143 RepID=A0A1R3FZ34_COCAP|nr:hypothetical protein CCACVL1_30007 [Corchorus capsularis]
MAAYDIMKKVRVCSFINENDGTGKTKRREEEEREEAE